MPGHDGVTVQRTEMVRLGKIHTHPKNARRGDIEVIGESLRRNGQYRPIVANRRTGDILVGNHTYLAAQAIGWEQILVSWVDVDEERAVRILLIDNRSSDLAGYDHEALLELLRELPSEGGGFRDLEGTGYTRESIDEIDALVKKLAEAPAAPDAFKDPEENLQTSYRCPSCGYEWSGRPKPEPDDDQGEAAAGDGGAGGEGADPELAVAPGGDPDIDPAADPDA